MSEHTEKEETLARSVRVLRLGHGANCSSVGSVIDTLFVSAVIGGALFAAVAAALRSEEVHVVSNKGAPPPAGEKKDEAGSP